MMKTLPFPRTAIAASFVAAAVALAAGQQAPPPPQQPQQQPPVFRTEADVIRLDVSVLDKDRRPVRGLTQEDFTVTEDGTPQRVVAVAAVDVAEHDPAPSAWMRHVPPDISTNDLVDQVGDGRLFAIVMDDVNIPWDDLDIIQGARMAARYVIDNLGASDIAAVVFPRDAGLTVDFTSDRRKLLEAIDQFDPREPDMFIPARPAAPGGGGGDMPYRWSPVLMRNECERSQPTVPTLDVLASRLATVPNRRKSIILVSTGIPLNLGASRDCPGDLAYTMREMFRVAQRANINIHSVDPAGYRGYEMYLMNPIRRGGRPAKITMSQQAAEGAAKFRREFLEITADHTGARAVTGNQAMEDGIDRIFEENESYYLLGYQTSNGKPDGKFRRVVVKVNRPDVTVRTRSGFYAPQAGSFLTREQKAAPTANDLSLSGLNNPAGLPLRASLVSLAPAADAKPGSRDVDVAVALSVRLPPGRGPIKETLTVVRNVYVNGKPGPPVREIFPITIEETAGDEMRYEVFQKLTLAPGRYEIRLHATSALLIKSGTVFADLEVPDFTRAPVVMSGITLGRRPLPDTPRTDALAPILPILPTSGRDFAPSEAVTVFSRVFQGGATPVTPVTVGVLVLDMNDKRVFEQETTMPVTAFGDGRNASQMFDLPLEKMQHGPHLLSITATLPSGTSSRRDLVFRVR
jgi:VWFA-related protein